VSVILFGVFHVEEITMPSVVEDAATLFLIANPTSQVQDDGEAVINTGTIKYPSKIVDIPRLANTLYSCSG